MANNLDRLFREHLDQLEITPSTDGWNQVKDRITKKRSGWMLPLSIAAAITVALTATVVVISLMQSEDHREFISSADHPVPPATAPWELKIPDPQTRVAQREPVRHKPAPVARANDTEQHAVFDLKKIESPSVTSIDLSLVKADFSAKGLALVNTQHEPEQPLVKITYIASDRLEAVDSTGTSKLNKVISIAKEVSPSDLLAGLRDAKDNLFRKN